MQTAWFNIPLDILQVILGTIFPANHLAGAKTSLNQITCNHVTERK